MKAAYNQNNIELYPLDEIYCDPCENCIFFDQKNCILLTFGKDICNELPKCWDAIFIPEPLSNIFEL